MTVAAVGFNENSILSSGDQSFLLSSLISIDSGQTAAPTLVVRAYDRDVYAGKQTFDYGYFTSPNGGQISAGTQYQPTTLYFDYQNGQYVSRDTGDPLSSFHFTTSAQNYRSVYLSLYTNDAAAATYSGTWLDPSWTHVSDIDVVTRTNFIDSTPNVATPQEIAAIAKTFIGKVWNSEGCWLLTSNITASAGASLPVGSARVDTAGLSGNGQWQVVYNGAIQTSDWRAMLQPGDIVELAKLGGGGHIATVTSGLGHSALWVDNSGASADDGVPTDIVIQAEHSVDDWTANAIDSTGSCFV